MYRSQNIQEKLRSNAFTQTVHNNALHFATLTSYSLAGKTAVKVNKQQNINSQDKSRVMENVH